MTRGTMLLVAMTCLIGGAAAMGGVPDTYRQLWNDAALQTKIERNIEQHRKGDSVIEVVNGFGKPVAGAVVGVRQVRHEFLFGCNAFVLGQLQTAEKNRRYEEAFARLFNFATLPFYWRDLEPEQGKPRFEEGSSYIWRRPPPDVVLKWCKERGITAKGHALMYSKTMFMPQWMDPADAGQLKRLGASHIARLAQRYGRDIGIWDVVNEEIPRLRQPQEWHAVPEDYLAWCFQEAARTFPGNTALLINDGTNEGHVTAGTYHAMIKDLIDRRVRIDGIGLQFHAYNRQAMFAGKQYPPSLLEGAYDLLGQLKLPLYITEITIAGSGRDGAEQQAAIVGNLYRLWFSVPQMAGLTWWNLADGTAYKNENQAMGGLLDEDLQPKPAYQVLDSLINKSWKSVGQFRTDAEGRAAFRGFYGTYQVEVNYDGQVRKVEIRHLRHGERLHRVTLP